jgi:hypothetical protein
LSRFAKGQSGNPAGRPRLRRPHVSAFDIIFDKTLAVIQGGAERELTVDEALQLQTYQAALKGSRMAVRAVLKMIEKREVAIARLAPVTTKGARFEVESDSDNAHDAMLLLGIVDYDAPPEDVGPGGARLKLATWAAQAAISRPGRRSLTDRNREDINLFVFDPGKLRWPRGKGG